ncbi:hypothetical protein tinsulaeT_36250 [Thalassotalea insulae]|uniref:histidine kinase n=1 Tax=Thalassotalea insulae TaxID=2056778 RepID=A0ABQ6GZU2_9GAMM|nr:GAF domain-containing sensor histidine kinase [Thalassotalea insulae]GLX80285.1 hypothetical protein tinsulaeT_36250 [Thalassotalea insulae]
MTELAPPDYSTLLVEQWSETLNLIAKILHVPTALIMKLENNQIKVFAKNMDRHNPYQINDSEIFDGSGLYCEHVVKSQKMLEVNNALTDPDWNDNPDIKLNMIYYLGLPLNYSDGTPFGTICVLDSNARTAKDEYKALLAHIKSNMEEQLHAYELQQRLFEKKNLKHIENLICAMAHELNTPTGVSITAVSVITSQLNELKKRFEQQTLSKNQFLEFVQQTEQCTALLDSNLAKTSTLIERFRDISEQLSLNRVAVNLQQFFTDMEKSYHRAYHEKVGFHITIAPDIKFVTIPMLLQSVIAQLVENAIEHAFTDDSKDNKVLISANVISDEVILTVEDNGIGFQLNDPNEVFSPGIRSDKRHSHIGLGLCIVQKTVLVQLKGTIKLKPSTNGSTFEIRLPNLTPAN